MEMLLGGTSALKAVVTVLILLGSPLSGQAQRSGTTTEGAFGPSSGGQFTCPSRSINYITQTLPQQCLRTDWSRETEAASLSSTRVEINPETSVSKAFNIHAVTATIRSESQNAIEPASGANTKVFRNESTITSTQSITPSSSSTTTALSEFGTTSAINGDSECDSPLDNANFLSFEEWKRQNLAKAGQSADHVGTRRAEVGEAEQRRRPRHINHAFDTLGEDTGIEIDFGGFVSPGVSSQNIPSRKAATDGNSPSTSGHPGEEEQSAGVPRSHPRGKDAGKTCKERSNYASFDCAATVLKTNPECKGSNSVLVENKDSYMLNECSAKNKFFIVELCDDILIDTVVLANFEFFSSMFRTFRVSVSDRYPVKLDKWRELGTFEARNSREIQAFLVETPLIWARYIRLEFLMHFGNEYYCPVSLLRVHGTTMMEEFNHELKSSIGEDDQENEVGESEEGEEPKPVSGATTTNALGNTFQASSEQATRTVADTPTPSPSISIEIPANPTQDISPTNVMSNPEVSGTSSTPLNSSLQSNIQSIFALEDPKSSVCAQEDQKSNASTTVFNSLPTDIITESTKAAQSASPHSVSSLVPTSTKETATESSNKSVMNSVAVPLNVSDSGKNQTKTHSPSSLLNQASQNLTKSHPSATQPPLSNPTTQESFFKSVHKRLQLLESNSTLSLQYIEDQSRILRDAFSAVEKRQLAKTTIFLETLNSTVRNELRDFRSQYDQIWQSTVLELSAQRESSRHEVLALSARISLLADEVLFQKRIAILSFVLILLCLSLVIFSRHGPPAHYLELPTLALNQSTSNLSGFGPHFETPPSTRPSSRYGLFGRGTAHERNLSSPPKSMRHASRYGSFGRRNAHERSPSEDSALNEGTKSPDIEFSPPTPTSQSTDRRGSGDEAGEAGEVLSESSDAAEVTRKIHSSPATLSGKRSGRRALEEGGLLTPEPEPEPEPCDK